MDCCKSKENIDSTGGGPTSFRKSDLQGIGSLYVCPMHSQVVSDKSGLCGECGMNLVPTKRSEKKEQRGVDKHKGHPEKSAHAAHGTGKTNIFARKFWVSAILSLPVIAYSKIFETIFKIEAPGFAGSEYIPFVLGSVIFFYGGWIFLISAWRELRGKRPGMMSLIALAITVAQGYSLAVTFGFPGEALYWEISTLIAIMLLGHWLEMRAVTGAQGALKELSKLLPDIAEVVQEDGQTKTVSLSELKIGDIVVVRPGARVPADGRVVEGKSNVDESMITGESRPVEKRAESEVIGGTINKDGSLKVKVEKIGEDTFLSGVMRLVAEAQSSKSKTQLLADKAAFYLTIVAIVVGITTFLAWLFFAGSGVNFAIQRLVAVMVITCPHALGVAIPLVASISTTKAAQNGFLVRQRLALEAARNIDIVLFDKTGTLTTGEYGVNEIWTAEGLSEEEVLSLAASVDSHSEHYISKAIVEEAKSRNLRLEEAKDFSRIAGRGVSGRVNGDMVYVGGAAIIDYVQTQLSKEMREQIGRDQKQSKTVIFVIKEKQVLGAIALADKIRPESKEAVARLKEAGIKAAMITGDSEDVAAWVAEELGLDEYFARVLPNEKADKVRELQNKGLKVAMVGDGINDAPALTSADIGVAIGAGTNVAIESAGIILVRSDPRDIPKVIKLSKLTYTKMIQNLFWATGYNVVAIPLAAGVLYFVGIVLQPAVAAILMSASTVIVAVNAVLLKGKPLA